MSIFPVVTCRPRQRVSLWLAVWGCCAVNVCCAFGGEAENFAEYVEPLLARRCYECHSHAAGEASGGLVLDSRAGWAVGGDSGPSVVPGKPEDSLLWKAVQYDLPHLQMPPEGRLPPEELTILEQWIRAGAFDSRSGGGTERPRIIDLEEGRKWWAFTPVETGIRKSGESVSAAVDRLIRETLSDHALSLAAPADRDVLLRRVTYDLTGLPPDSQRTDRLLRGPESDWNSAYAAYVDELLASPQFGEKWGRHWLDLARYADSNGASFNPPFRAAWRYRNWVIQSINDDLSVRDFIAAQLAGDLMPAETQAQADRNLIATGFLMLGSKVLGEFDKEQLTLDVVDEQLDTIGKSLLGMTVGCARCHDHKFDPIPQVDYYALAGILSSTVTLEDRLGGPKEDESDWSRRGLGEGGDQRLQEFLKDNRYAWIKATAKRFQAISALQALTAPATENASSVSPEMLQKAQAEVQRATETLTALEAQMPPYAMAVRDATKPEDIPLRIRGVPASRGDIVPRGFLQVVARVEPPAISGSVSGRLQLAEWITSNENPLTARVYVNRVWKHLFREGLVRSVDNFGTTGELPTHSRLLDLLAGEFVAADWHLKPLVRQLVLADAYRCACGTPGADDPENRLLAVQNRRRLEAEEIRDTMLWLADALDQSPGGGMIDQLPIGDLSSLGPALDISDTRRTIYQPIFRTLEDPLLRIFDGADTAMTTGARSRTVVATQALYFLNAEAVRRTADHLGRELRLGQPAPTGARNVADDAAALVRAAFSRIVCRPPTQAELAILVRYLIAQGDVASGITPHDVSKLCQAILASTQFQFLE